MLKTSRPLAAAALASVAIALSACAPTGEPDTETEVSSDAAPSEAPGSRPVHP